MGGGGVVLLNITFSFYISFTACFQWQSAIITWRCWKWLHSVTVFEELRILRETGRIGNCIVAAKCGWNLDWGDWSVKKHLVYGFVINSNLLVLKRQHFWRCRKQFLYINERQQSSNCQLPTNTHWCINTQVMAGMKMCLCLW